MTECCSAVLSPENQTKVVYHVHVFGYTAGSRVQLVYCVQLYDNVFCMTTVQRCLLSKVLAKQGDFSRLYTVPASISLSTLLYGWAFGLTTYQSTN